MKQQLLLFFMFFVAVGFHLSAQDILYNGQTYQVKGESIYIGPYEVTESLTFDAQKEIKAAHREKISAYRKRQKERRRQEKEERKLEKQEQKEAKKAAKLYGTNQKEKKPKKFLIF